MERDLNNFIKRYDEFSKKNDNVADRLSFSIAELKDIIELSTKEGRSKTGYFSLIECLYSAIWYTYRVAFIIGYEKGTRDAKRKDKSHVG